MCTMRVSQKVDEVFSVALEAKFLLKCVERVFHKTWMICVITYFLTNENKYNLLIVNIFDFS